MMKRIFIFASAAATLPVLGMVTSAIAQSGVQSGDGFVTAGGVLPAGMPSTMDPADRLASSLRLLAQNPYDIGALTQAGESALAVGDANAAIGFLARAEGLSPANGRIKSSLASALVLVERPNEALRLFSEAQALGIPETGLARDRGLAYDLSGDPKRAQRDYHLVLRSRGDDEVTRRLALSMGIAGEKDAALKQLEPLIRKRDQAAWRARAFIMAMNGDLVGAERIAQQVVPANMMTNLVSFMGRLPRLTSSQKAYAVNFGTMPSQDTRQYAVQSTDPFRPIGDNAAAGLNPPVVVPAPVATAPLDRKARLKAEREARRRPDRDQVAVVTPRPVVPLPPPLQLPSRPAAQAPVTVAAKTEPATPSWANQAQGQRVGARIGPVDPARLPAEIRSVAQDASTGAALAKPPTVIVQQTKMTKLPEPTREDQVAAVLRSTGQAVVPAPARTPTPAPPKVIESAPLVPSPTFEIPAPAPKAVVSPAPTPVQVALVTPKPLNVPPAAPLAIPPAPMPPPIAKSEPLTFPITGPVAQIPAPSPSVPNEQPKLTPPTPTLSSAEVPGRPLAEAEVKSIMGPPAPIPSNSASLTTSPSPSLPSATMANATPPSALPPSPGFSTSLSVPPSASVTPPPTQITPLPNAAQPTPLPETQIVATAPESVAVGPVDLPKMEAKPAAAPAAQPVQGLAAVLEGITPEQESNGGPVMSDAEFRRARLSAKRKAEAEALAEAEAKTAETAAADAKAKEKARLEVEEAEKKRLAALTPERIWVQVATGSNRAGLVGTLKGVRDKAPDALKGVGGATVPFKATHRVLVGPFKSQAEARSMISKLAKQGVSATSFTSSAGQEVNKLSQR